MLKYLFSKSFLRLLLIFAGITLVLLGSLYVYLNIYTGHGEVIEVPDSKGMTIEEAENVFSNAGLEFSVVDSIYSAGAKAGTIVEQNPTGGAQVKPGRIIYLSVYRSEPPVEIIDIKEGESIKVAAIRLRNKGIEFDVEYEPNVLLDGRVIRVLHKGREIAEGSGVKRGAKIKLIVGKRGDEEVYVPLLTGLTLDSAYTKLIDGSLTMGYPFYDAEIQTSQDSSMARVYKQSPASGKDVTIRVGSPVDVWLTLRPVSAVNDTSIRSFPDKKIDLP